MNPNFGGGLRDFIFEQISNNSTAEIKERVQDILNVYFTRIDVDELDETSKTMKQPSNIKIKLKPHQLTLLLATMVLLWQILSRSTKNTMRRMGNLIEMEVMIITAGIAVLKGGPTIPIFCH